MSEVSSYIAERKKKLGVTGQVERTDASSYIQTRKMDMGLIPDTRPKSEPRLETAPSPEIETRKIMAEKGIDHAGLLRNTNTLSNRLAASAAEQEKAERAAKEAKEAERRKLEDFRREDRGKLPWGLRHVVQGLDWIADKTKPAADVALELYTPGGGLSAVAGLTKGALFGAQKALPALSNSAAGRVAQTALAEAAVGAPLGVSNTLARNMEASPKEIAEGAAFGAGGGALIGAAGKSLGEAAAAGLRGVRQATESQLGAANAIDRAANATQYGSRLKLDDKAKNVSRIMENIRGDVTEAMTPPLESEKALRQWIKPFLGNPSNKTLERLSYNDLVEIAEEARKGMNVYDTAVQVAQRRGIDLERAFEQAPSIRDRAAQDSTRRAYGITPDNLPPVSRPLTRNAPEPRTLPEIPTPRDGPEPMGISAFGRGGKFTNPEDTRTYIASNTDREPLDVEGLWDRFYSKTTDDLQRINQFDKYAEKTTGKKLSPEERSYYLALNSRGADMTSNHILTERLVDAQGNVIGESLKDITSKIPKRAYTNFTDYLIARHAETRMARGEKVYDKRTNMTPEKVAQKIAEYERTYPEFKDLSDHIYDWNEKLTKAWLVDTGIITPEMAKAWKDANPNWVPNKRFFSKLERAGKGFGAKRGFGNQSNPVKKYSPEGSERPIIDPIESMIEYVDKYVKVARRNEVMQTLVKNLEKDPENLSDFATILKREKVDPKSVNGEKGMDSLIDQLDGEYADAFEQLKKSDLDKGNVISGLIDGERVYVRVNDPALLESLVNLNPKASVAFLEAARKATNFVKLLTTGINPIFSITRNIIRDIPQAYISSKTTNNPFRFGWDMLDSIVSTLGNRELYKRYKAVGGGHSSPVASDRNLLAQSKQSILPQRRQGLGLLPRAYGALENLSNVIEAAPRLSEFKRVTKQGGDTYGSRVKGLYEANDITTNFKRKGNVTKEADAVVMYLNAAVQGLDKTIRTFKDNPKAAIPKAFLAVTVPTIALYALNHDNPDYENLSNFQKDNFYNIPTGDGKFVKLPKPREIGVPFGSMVERALRQWNDEDPEAFRDFANTVTVAFTPPGIPSTELAQGNFKDAAIAPFRDTVFGPIIDVASNKNFTGAPIVPGYLENLSPRNQYDAGSSEIGKKIGDILNVSPKEVDHLIRSYTGVVGQLGLPAATKDATIKDTLVRQVTADPVFTNDDSRYFYELKSEIDTQYNDIRATGEVPEGYNDSVRKYLNGVADDMSAISKALRAIDDMDIPRQERRDKKRELSDLRNNLARTAYRAVKGYDQGLTP